MTKILIILILFVLNVCLLVFLVAKKENKRVEHNKGTLSEGGGVTVIVLNYERPHNMDKVLKSLEGQVERVIVLNGKKETAIKPSQGVEAFDDCENNSLYGGARRFLFEDIQTPYVMFLDDDIVPAKGSIEIMRKVVSENGGLSGPFGRTCNVSDGYKTDHSDTVLTGFSMMKTDLLNRYQEVFSAHYNDLLAKTHGNGEDLSMNHFIREIANEPVTYTPNAKYTELDNSGGYSSKGDHYEKRDRICKYLFSDTAELESVSD